MKISVIITSFNLSEYIEECVNSIINQDVLPDEIILCDDASTDDTIRLATARCPSLVVIRQNVNCGALLNTLAGLNQATGDIISFIDGDDTWPINKIRTVLQEFYKDSGVFLVTHNHKRVNSLAVPIGEIDDTHRNMQRIIQVPIEQERQLLLRRAVLLREGLWLGSAYSLRRSAIDLNLFNNLVKANIQAKNAYLDLVLAPFVVQTNECGRIVYLHDLEFYYRLHSNNSASSQTVDKQMRAIKRGRATSELTKSVLSAVGAEKNVIEKYEFIMLEFEYLTALYEKRIISSISMFFKLLSYFKYKSVLLKEMARFFLVLIFGSTVFLRYKSINVTALFTPQQNN
jgi:glycosyltransferase involved in cell wall biosynthesis